MRERGQTRKESVLLVAACVFFCVGVDPRRVLFLEDRIERVRSGHSYSKRRAREALRPTAHLTAILSLWYVSRRAAARKVVEAKVSGHGAVLRRLGPVFVLSAGKRLLALTTLRVSRNGFLLCARQTHVRLRKSVVEHLSAGMPALFFSFVVEMGSLRDLVVSNSATALSLFRS